jgi:hypothetical protein
MTVETLLTTTVHYTAGIIAVDNIKQSTGNLPGISVEG